MAGDWIKMRSDLFGHPKVFAISEALGKDELFTIGALFAFWAWLDKHSVDGRVDGATPRLVDAVTHVSGLAQALINVDWMSVDEKGISVPEFDEHNGDSAKERSLKNQRQARWRQRKSEGLVDEPPSTKTSTYPSTREEKRREEKEVNARFNEFWEAYPRKDSKAASLKAFSKIAPTEQLHAEILAGVKRAATSEQWSRDDGKFIPHASTWLNQRRWEDQGTASGGANGHDNSIFG